MNDPPITRPSLLARLRDPGDERAWEEFLELYTPLLLRLARRKGLQQADAADLAQDVFGAVVKAIDGWDPDPARGSFRGWLSRTARNLIVNMLESQRKRPRGTGETDFQAFLECQPAPGGEGSLLFDEEYRRRLFAWAADRVKGEFRAPTWAAFWATGVECREPRDVAGSLGITVGAVYIARSRVMARIRREIETFEGRKH